MTDYTEKPCGNDATHGRREEAIMPQVVSCAEFANSRRGSELWIAHFQAGEGVKFCLGLDAPNTKALQHGLWKGMFVIPECGMPSREELYEALILFKKEAQKRGYISADMTDREFARELLGKFSKEGGDD